VFRVAGLSDFPISKPVKVISRCGTSDYFEKALSCGAGLFRPFKRTDYRGQKLEFGSGKAASEFFSMHYALFARNK
jgi:hypothetical protein